MNLNLISLMFLWILYSIVNKIQSVPSEDTTTLVLVHVLFRHGNRTPSPPNKPYPKDPYLNETYFPFGRGQLTNAGKQREYSLGKALRKRYNKFLGPYYYPEIVESKSTDFDRTKMSLELVLAGLFPPNKKQVWNRQLNWQPIPYNYLNSSNIMILSSRNCPNYLKQYNLRIQSDEVQAEFSKYKETFHYISENTGLNITKFLDVLSLYFGLACEEEWGFKLPEWTHKVWPQTIKEMALKEYLLQTSTTNLRRITSGYFIQKIINDTIVKMNGGSPGKKMYLYSGHELNIAHLLRLLENFDPPQVPKYGAYVTLEIHKINETYGIKIYHENYTADKPQLLKLPDCDTFCPFDKFMALMEKYIPSADFCYQ